MAAPADTTAKAEAEDSPLIAILLGPGGAVAAGLASIGAYALAIIQTRRKFPDQWRTYAGQFLMTGAGAVAVGRLRGFDLRLLALIPLGLVVVGVIAGRGSVANLIHDPDSEEAVPREVHRARMRGAVLLSVVCAAGSAAYIVLAP